MNILNEIIKNKKQELKKNKSNKERFKKIFSKKNANIIGEIKLKSPTKYEIIADENKLETIYNFYGKNKNIKAISILIDKIFFNGDIKRGQIIKQRYNKPIFLKEFVIEEKQIDGASYYGYDALLLLKRVLKTDLLTNLIKYSLCKNIFPIVEVDNEKDLKEIIELSQKLELGIAINSRNLGNMQIDINSHFTLYNKYKDQLANKIIFAFSGINNLDDIKKYKNKYNGVLIGTYFMKNIE
ncbi:MAG: hypothetical protein PHN31_02860 [Candidatus Gracilibacteria bacterium]|nr:hypothetical protein [Candidatus Gracilibacteria bacterium]